MRNTGLALALVFFIAGAAAQALQPPRLTGTIEERQQDLRRDSGGQLLGLTQGDVLQDISALSGVLPPPARPEPRKVCFKARNRDGTYTADGELTAPPGDAQALPVEAPGFPELARKKDLVKSSPRELAMLFHPAPCGGRQAMAYPAAFGARRVLLTATLNLGSLNGTPSARLQPVAGGGAGIEGACAQLAGRSVAFNVLCTFTLPPGFPGGEHMLSVDYKPSRGPGTTSDFRIWTAPHQP